MSFITSNSMFFRFLITTSILASNSAFADEKTLPAVVVSGERASDSLFRKETIDNLMPATVDAIDLTQLPKESIDRPEDAFRLAGIGSSSANEAGLGTGLNIRGFDVGSRLFINGHPDIQRLYVRDLATVDTVEVLKGHSSVLYGQGAPGGTINYILHKPLNVPQSEAQFSVDSYGLGRVVFDHNQPIGNSAIRFIYAGQTGGTFIEDLNNRRQSLLLSGRHNYDSGSLSAEIEYQRNERPFSFGTVFAGGRFWFDRYYLAPEARSVREYYREAIYLDHKLGAGWSLNAAMNFAQVNRRETLAGFWTLTSDTTVSSYYRKLHDDVDQNNVRLELRGMHTLFGMKNETTAGYQRDKQNIDFSGPQSIEAFSIDLEKPNFNVNWNALQLTPKKSQERYDESGLFWFDQLQVSDNVRAIAGLRESALRIQTGIADISTATTADIRHLSSVAGLTWSVRPQLSLHLARSESFEPNQGMTHEGRFLQPREGRQWETGIAYDAKQWAAKLAMFDIRQSNLTATDPLDKDALITIGAIRVQGIETAARWDYKAFSLSANMSWQRAWNSAKVSNDLGDKIVNVPSIYGAVRLSWRTSPVWTFWGAFSGVGQRMGDPENSFTAPGYTTIDAGMRYRFDTATAFSLEVSNATDKRYVEALSAADNVYQGQRRRIVASIHRYF